MDFESTSSANSNTPANATDKIIQGSRLFGNTHFLLFKKNLYDIMETLRRGGCVELAGTGVGMQKL